MATLKVLQAGPCVSVQDIGRPGFLRDGISQGGAIDQIALEEGRLLVGNERGLAALEILGPGGHFEVGDAAICVAMTGTKYSLKLDAKAVDPYASFTVQPGQVLEIGAASSGNYGYLSIAGGIDTTPVLGSRSTHLKGGFGGFEGRRLKQGDVLPIGKASHDASSFALPKRVHDSGEDIRILWAVQSDFFSDEEMQRFVETPFEISPAMDRMGTRLNSEAEPVHVQSGLVALSGVIALGDIQIPGNGRPVVLLADRQPTGGYPRIATIIGADITNFVQRPVGSKLNFKPISQDEAVEALAQLAAQMKQLPDRLIRIKSDDFSSGRLLSENLISGVVSSDDPSRNSK